jgi:hypothetical protein
MLLGVDFATSALQQAVVKTNVEPTAKCRGISPLEEKSSVLHVTLYEVYGERGPASNWPTTVPAVKAIATGPSALINDVELIAFSTGNSAQYKLPSRDMFAVTSITEELGTNFIASRSPTEVNDDTVST